jgi:hypothetical protein
MVVWGRCGAGSFVDKVACSQSQQAVFRNHHPAVEDGLNMYDLTFSRIACTLWWNHAPLIKNSVAGPATRTRIKHQIGNLAAGIAHERRHSCAADPFKHIVSFSFRALVSATGSKHIAAGFGLTAHVWVKAATRWQPIDGW